MSIASKATMLPLHQRCSHEYLWWYKNTLPLCQKLIEDLRAKFQRGNAAPKHSLTYHNFIVRESNRCQYTNYAHIKSYDYTMRNSPLVCQKLIDDRREKVQRESAAPKQSSTDHNCIVRELNPMSIAWKATMLPLHQRCSHELWWINTRSNSTLLSKIDRRSERKSAERKRCTKTIANGSQLHRTGIEPMSMAWKATMLPLHQRCSHENLLLYKEKQSSCVKN